ncbi:sugar porter family MFS transporter [Liquorilactobacillus mali]|uniref:D-xylose proton-symporter n=1 Tax=Liquorilactobacillus mali TaxID=1618 RepID=A0A0R2FQM6_9LACO|nr:sugar porter family MFS transporter [Liquorilactobacillus mali]KRN30688.1 D-xylose proton-symporter [Liquorilactobacillus mali]MDN7145751.1 sugar porter family MFS transporter [Liquorilactobacillus mali]
MDSDNQDKSQTSFLKYCVYVISLGGFLFGYDTGVINGALAFMSKSTELNLNPTLQGVVSSSLILGACIGALGCGRVADHIGRRRTLRLIAIVFTISTILCAFAINFWLMASFRFILGVAVGAASGISPMYLAEISPRAVRTVNVNKNAIAIVLGQLVAFVVNAILGNVWGDWSPIWRVMIFSASIPAVILWIGSFKIANSPIWIMAEKQYKKAKGIFKKLGFNKLAYNKLKENSVEEEETEVSWKNILKNKSLCYLLVCGMLIALIQQISGVNAVMYYGTILMEKVGMGQGDSLYANILIGFVSLIASLAGTRLIDRYNHRKMLVVGLIGNVLFLFLLGMTMKTALFSQMVTNVLVLVFLALFLACHQGIVSPVTWLILTEIFPNRIKARLMSVSTATVWLSNFVISLIFPVLISVVGTATAFFAFAITNSISIVFSTLVLKNNKLRKAYKAGMELK